MSNVASIFSQFLKSSNLETAKLLLMVSGGVDSMVLLDLALKSLPADQLAVFHLDHNARLDSGKDLNFVQNLCSKNNIKFYSEKLDTQPLINVEAPWREERKRLSQKAADDFGATKILTAHHATDLTETMIFRLTKGAGPNGLSPFDISTKPFWNMAKQTLLKYAQEHQLEWQEDVTNLNTKFERNLIRAEVLPTLRKITPNLETVFVRESETFAQLQDFLSQQLNFSCQTELKQKSITLKKFLDLHPALQREFLRAVALKIPSQAELDDCLKWLHNEPQGNSIKKIGGTLLGVKTNHLYW